MKRFNRISGEEALVVAFESTASALAFSSGAQAAGLSGRLIPIPRTLSAGCGMAWREDARNRARAEELARLLSLDDVRFVEMPLP